MMQTMVRATLDDITRQTQTAMPTATPTITPTATITPTPTWAFFPSGNVVAPIILYHHVSDEHKGDRYYMPTARFKEQMQWLFDHGYRTITATQLLNVLISGGTLPERPVVITFDDGDLDVYKNAFPIMQQYGFSGTFYLVASYLNGKDNVTTDQVKQMIAVGWEIGSHSMTHVDLTKDYSVLDYELVDSRTRLEQKLGVKIDTFAYPFGAFDSTVGNATAERGYLGGMGLGTTSNHSLNNRFYLSRIEIQSRFSLDDFAALLPWK